MTGSDDRVPLDEKRRAFVAAMLRRMPESIGQAILADESVREDMDFVIGPSVRMFERRFDGTAVMSALRDLANGRPVVLRSVDGTVKVEAATLDGDGNATLVVGDHGARFANVGLLSEDTTVRMSTLDALIGVEDLDGADEERLRAACGDGPLDDEAFADVERLVEETPTATYRRLHAEVAGGVTFDTLVPADEGFFRALLGGAPAPTLAEFRATWLARTESLEATRRAGWIALTAPLAVLRGGLVARGAAGLDRAVRLRLARFLTGSPDPFSQLAGFELAAVECADPEFRSIGDELLPRLMDIDDPRTAAGLSFLASAMILSATFSSKRGALIDWPVYARRLAWHIHSSILTRTFGNGAIDAEEMRRLVGTPFEQNFRLVELCDARTAPLNLWRAVSPPSLHAAVVRRLGEVLTGIPDDLRPAEWSTAFEAASADVASKPEALSYLAPGPFDQFEESWAGLPVHPDDEIADFEERMSRGEDVQRSLTDLLLLAVAFEVEPGRRPNLAAGIPPFLAKLPDDLFPPAADLSLQLAARWRLPDLAGKVVDLSLARLAAGSLEDLGAPARFSLLAGASIEAADACAVRIGECISEFAFALKAGAGTRNMLTAIGLISEFAPTLIPVLASARSFALMANDTLPARSVDQIET